MCFKKKTHQKKWGSTLYATSMTSKIFSCYQAFYIWISFEDIFFKFYVDVYILNFLCTNVNWCLCLSCWSLYNFTPKFKMVTSLFLWIILCSCLGLLLAFYGIISKNTFVRFGLLLESNLVWMIFQLFYVFGRFMFKVWLQNLIVYVMKL